MDQRSPQNIEELLQQLKTTVDQTDNLSDGQPLERGKRVSDAKMQEELKKRFMDSSYAYDTKEEDDDYALDDDFCAS